MVLYKVLGTKKNEHEIRTGIKANKKRKKNEVEKKKENEKIGAFMLPSKLLCSSYPQKTMVPLQLSLLI